MKKTLLTVNTNNNEITLIQDGSKHYIHWGEPGKPKSKKRITTPSGRNPCQNTVHKQFFQAVEATKHLTFKSI